MNPWSQPLAAWLLDFTWITTAILLAASALRFVLRNPASRVQLAWATWLSVLVTAVLVASPTWPRWELQELYQSQTPSPPNITAVDQPAISEPLVVIESTDLEVPALSKPTVLASIPIAWREWVAVTWLGAAIVACGWIAIGFSQARRLVQTSQPAPAWIVEEAKSIVSSSLPIVRMSHRLSSAIALGTLRSHILLPSSSAEPSSAPAVRAALAHEWAHIRHGDLWLLALERFLVPLLALHPLFWWLRRATRLDQELLADAAAAGQQPVEYAEALLAWAKTPTSATVGLAALAMWDRPSNLSRRVHMILTEKRPQRTWLSRLGGAFAAGTVLCASLVLSLLTVAAQQPADEPVVPQNQSAPEPSATLSPVAVPSTTEPTPVPAAEPSTATPVPQSRINVPAMGSAPSAFDFFFPVAPATAANASPSANNDKVLTFKLALFALDRADFPKTRKQVIESIEQLAGQPMVKAEATERRNAAIPKIIEIDSSRDSDLVMDIQSIEGVKLISRATVVAMGGKQAHLNLAEWGPHIEIEEEQGGKIVRREQRDLFNYLLLVKPQPLGVGLSWNVDIDVNRGRSNSISPTTSLRTQVNIGRTLVMVSSEPYALLVTPLKVEPRVTGVGPGTTASIVEAKMAGVPATHPINTPPAGSIILPVPSSFQTTPSTPGARTFQTAPSMGPASGTFQTAPGLGPGTFQTTPPVIPALPTRPADVINPTRPPVAVELPRTAYPSLVTTSTAPVPTNAAERQLLELDLAEAKLDVQLAEAELADLEEIRKKSPQAASLSELRKRQLQVERAKIQLRRIEIRLDGSNAPAETTPAPAPAKPT